jgi:hypothetical protein
MLDAFTRSIPTTAAINFILAADRSVTTPKTRAASRPSYGQA